MKKTVKRIVAMLLMLCMLSGSIGPVEYMTLAAHAEELSEPAAEPTNEPTPAPTAEPTPAPFVHDAVTGQAIVDTAMQFLGTPYVWGGASPSTSFDCSGFVSWVINHCGNGWNIGRKTANGLKSLCAVIPRNEAKPGDLIFFQGTYDTAGASHVGIYVGNGMMIHCGNPIQYASINASYWQAHFYCFGRLP